MRGIPCPAVPPRPARSQYQAASAAIKVYAAQQKLEAWQKEQDRKQAVAAATATKEGAAAGEASKDSAEAKVCDAGLLSLLS